MTKKQFLVTLTAGLLSASAAFPAMAGTWKTGTGENAARWWYDNGDRTWAANGWHWIDGNQDGISECYYFDTDGWLLTSSATPDGYTVNADGAWIVNGVIQTKQSDSAAQPQDEESWEDFQNRSSKTSSSSQKSAKTRIQPIDSTSAGSNYSDDTDSASDDIFDDSDENYTNGASDTSSSSHSSKSGPSKEASSSSGDKKPDAPKKTKQEPGSGYRQGSVTDEEIANNTSSDSSEE